MSLDGEIALVTGASRGIGAAIAQALQEAGASVIGTATSQAGAEAIAARSPDMRGMVLDVADSACVEALFSRLGESGSMPGIVVNNAGITRDGLILRMTADQWGDVLRVNLTGAFHVCKAASRQLLKQRSGSIVNVSSVVGVVGNAGQANYAAA
ncbi:MAG: SDR family NAD(P)-dependent oxidoreductase, partial [Gammaproteobacteria bacterium]|nr:SDR family NAD(P)-dependent oxidoreductase [Gammaproteobacteria bacterium]